MRVVVATVLAANAVLVAQHLLNLSAQSDNRSGPSAGEESRAKKQLGSEERAGEKGRGVWKHVRNSLWQFGTGRSCFVQKPSSSDCQTLLPHLDTSFPRHRSRSRNRAPRRFNYPRSVILPVPFGNSDGRGVSLQNGTLVAITFFGLVFCPDHPERNLRPNPPLCQLVGNPSCILAKKKGTEVYKTRAAATRRGRGSGR
jgi:hypothetical protein